MESRPARRQFAVASCLFIGLAAISVVAYGRVFDHSFVSYDDPTYVLDNHMVREGLSAQTVAWAFDPRHGYAANWHPLTWMSHMLDAQLFGFERAGGSLGVNLLLHVLNVWLLFLVLWRMTRPRAGSDTGAQADRGSMYRSAFVAALFAVHPLHVESVAWVSERKDVLSGLFWMLGMGAYAWYAARPSWERMALVGACLALGLMAKATVVTFPLALLLLDVWPLRRATFESGRSDGAAKWAALVVEKLPLFALVVLASILTYVAQERGGAVNQGYPLLERVANALVVYGAYLAKAVWPSSLAVFYPHTAISREIGVSAFAVPLLSACFLALITALAIGQRRKRPYLLIGWLFFVGTMVPMSGVFVQVGEQAMADRYTYIPLIGIFIMIAWGVPDLVAGWKRRHLVLGIAALATIAMLTLLSWRQVGVWRDSESLFRHATQVTEKNAYAHAALGLELRRLERRDEALDQCRRSVELDAADWSGQYCAGLVLLDLDRAVEATTYAEQAVRLAPGVASPHAALGSILARQGRHAEAIRAYEIAVRLEPESVTTQLLLGKSLAAIGRLDAAAATARRVLDLERDNLLATLLLADVAMRQGDSAEAIRRYRAVLTQKPDQRAAANNLAWLLATNGDGKGDAVEAVRLAEAACRGGETPEILDTLAASYAAAGRFEDAALAAERGLELARRENNAALTKELAARLASYRAGRPSSTGTSSD